MDVCGPKADPNKGKESGVQPNSFYIGKGVLHL